ncbi:MAG: hypothetical protein AB7S41_09045 [Parvibaculaceae bacterium]
MSDHFAGLLAWIFVGIGFSASAAAFAFRFDAVLAYVGAAP